MTNLTRLHGAVVIVLAAMVSGCSYNRFTGQEESIKAAWSEVQNQLQRRNDLIERIDVHLLASLAGVDISRAQQNSETAGSIIDRCSILALKIHHMRINAGRTDDAALAAECAGKLAILETQRSDLAACLVELLADHRAGRRFFKLYRQFKSYNDPRLNPALYKRR